MTHTSATYLDYNATAPLLPAARRAMENALENTMSLTGNPSSVHHGGRQAHAVIEDAREAVASMMGVAPACVIFTSGGTEANALALAQAHDRPVFFSAVEHVSVLEAATGTALPVGRDGRVCLQTLGKYLKNAPGDVFVSIMAANNETGIRQPVAEAAGMVREHGGIIHCDAIQVAGREPWNPGDVGVHLTSISAHKLGGPAGVGALVLTDESFAVTPTMRGGGQERGQRPGTANIVGIAGFGAAAAAAAASDRYAAFAALAHKRDAMEAQVLRQGGVTVFGADVARLPNTSCIASHRHQAGTLVMALDLEGIAVSAGAACSSGKIDESHVLQAMGADADNALRVSLGWETDDHDITRFISAWDRLHDSATGERSAA